MRFWKYVKDLMNIPNEELSQDNSLTGDSSEEQSNEVNNQSQEQSENQSQNDSSSDNSSEEQSNEVNNQPQQQGGEQNQNGSQSGNSSEEQIDEMNNQSQEQSGNQNQNDSSTGDSLEEQSNDMNNQSQEQGGNQSQSDSSSEDSLEEIESEINDTLTETPTDNLEERKEKLQQLRDKLLDYAKKKQEDEKRSTEKSKLNGDKKEATESKEEKYELSEQTNNFINQLNELPSFENRGRGAGYSIDTSGYTEVPDSVIRTLITKFLNQRFCKKTSDLNVRSNSLEKTKGFYKWEVKDVITHLETHQITKVLTDKYGYEYAQGKNENVPLSFYFDMSGSMSSYTNMLAVIAIELLKKNVKVLVGFNERVNVQIESINGNIDVETLAKILESAGYYSGWYGTSSREKFIKDPRVSYKYVDKNIDNYLIGKKAEKCVVFADFDPKREVENLSQKAQVYWFCFEDDYSSTDLKDFRGFIYPVQNIRDIAEGLIKVNDKRFETLCYTDNPKTLQRKIGG